GVPVLSDAKGRAIKEQARSPGRRGERGRLAGYRRCGHRHDAPDAARLHREPGRRRDGLARDAPTHPLDARTLAPAQWIRSGRSQIGAASSREAGEDGAAARGANATRCRSARASFTSAIIQTASATRAVRELYL